MHIEIIKYLCKKKVFVSRILVKEFEDQKIVIVELCN